MAVEKIVAIGVALGISFTAGWTVNGWRHELKIRELKLNHSLVLEASAMDSLNAYKHMELVKDDAIKSAEERAIKNAIAANMARTTADRLRGELAKVPDRISTASRAAVDQYASTASELFGTCAAEYQEMARFADEHLSNERLLIDAWPKNVPAQTAQ